MRTEKKNKEQMGKEGKKLVKKGKGRKLKKKNGMGIIFCNNLYFDSWGSDQTQSDVVIKHKNIIIRNYSKFFKVKDMLDDHLKT